VSHLVSAASETASAALLAVDDLRPRHGAPFRRAFRRDLERRVSPGAGVFSGARSRYPDPKFMDEAGNEALQESDQAHAWVRIELG